MTSCVTSRWPGVPFVGLPRPAGLAAVRHAHRRARPAGGHGRRAGATPARSRRPMTVLVVARGRGHRRSWRCWSSGCCAATPRSCAGSTSSAPARDLDRRLPPARAASRRPRLPGHAAGAVATRSGGVHRRLRPGRRRASTTTRSRAGRPASSTTPSSRSSPAAASRASGSGMRSPSPRELGLPTGVRLVVATKDPGEESLVRRSPASRRPASRW